MALAPAGGEYEWNILLASFNRNPGAADPHEVTLVLTGLSGLDKVRVSVSTVDEKRNNWWPEWTKFREEHDIPYVAGPNRGHLGANVLYKPESIRNTNDILGTMRPQDREKWLSQSDRYTRRPLEQTAVFDNVPVVDGAATIKLPAPASSLSLIHVKPVGAAETMRPWELREVALPLGESPASKTLDVAGLLPDTSYTLSVQAVSSMRVADYGVALQSPDGGGRVEGYGDYSGRPNMIVLTTRTDSSGALKVIPFTPAQKAAAGDQARFTFLSLAPTVPTIRAQPPAAKSKSTAPSKTDTP
jgi:hypothetical protein